MVFASLSLIVAMALAFGVASAFGVVFYSRWRKKYVYKKVISRLVHDQYGNLKDLESFGDYVGKIIVLSAILHNSECVYIGHSGQI